MTAPEQPYGPGALCDDCGHMAFRHDETGCHGVYPERGCSVEAPLARGRRRAYENVLALIEEVGNVHP